MAFENYTVRQFRNAWFSDDYSSTGIPKKDFHICYEEYIDYTKAYQTDIFDKIVYIQSIRDRINGVNTNIRLQREFIEEFGLPYVDKLVLLENYGYFISSEDILEKFKQIEQEEKVYVSELETNIKELSEMKERSGIEEKPTIKKSREIFIKTLNSLGKIGYRIDIDKTTVEELALMINQQNEDNE